jgi:uncharacterized protein YceH (UPF0502 family)
MTLAQPILLTTSQARVLGALVEKEATTPDYYPMSMNALVNACNQRSNREPITDLDEEAVRLALHRLEDLQLAGRARSADGRVTKYEHWLGEAFNFSRAEAALICVLLLRGPQTPGELRGRSERLHRFAELDDVIAGLQKLMEREPPLVAILPRQPGTKESRYVHLLCGPVDSAQSGSAALTRPQVPVPAGVPLPLDGPSSDEDPGSDPRILRLESAVRALQHELAALKKRFDDLYGDG